MAVSRRSRVAKREDDVAASGDTGEAPVNGIDTSIKEPKEFGKLESNVPRATAVNSLSVVRAAVLPVVFAVAVVGCAWVYTEPIEWIQLVDKPKVKLKLFGFMLLGYWFMLHCVHAILQGWHLFAETLWGCNVSLGLAGMGMVSFQPQLIGCAICITGLYHFLWCLDCLGFLVLRRWPIGVAKFLSSSYSPKAQLVARAHHFFFLPLCFWALYAMNVGMPEQSYVLCVAINSSITIAARILTPYSVSTQSNKNAIHVHVLNVNMAYSFFGGVEIPILHWMDFKSPLIYLAYLLSVCNLFLNPPFVLIFYAISNYLIGKPVPFGNQSG